MEFHSLMFLNAHLAALSAIVAHTATMQFRWIGVLSIMIDAHVAHVDVNSSCEIHLTSSLANRSRVNKLLVFHNLLSYFY